MFFAGSLPLNYSPKLQILFYLILEAGSYYVDILGILILHSNMLLDSLYYVKSSLTWIFSTSFSLLGGPGGTGTEKVLLKLKYE